MKKLLVFLILLAPFGILFPFINDFAFPVGSNYSDLAISHYPNAVFLLKSLAEWHQIPLWSNTILSGYPFASDPLSGLWYLPGWLAYVFPLPLGFNLNIIFHLLFGGIGVFLFLHKGNRSGYAALAGALIFELYSKTFAHYAAGHISLIYAVAWTPWVFVCEKYFSGSKKYLLGAVILGMTALADVRWFAFLVFAWGLFAGVEWLQVRQERWTKLGLRIGLTTALALLIGAVLLVPLLEFTRLSTRSALTAADSLSFSLPPAYLVNLFVPNFNAYAEWVIYPGGGALVLALFSLSIKELRRKNSYWLGLIFVALLIALGSATPLGGLLFRLPGFDLLRVPSRVTFLLGLAFAVLAADCFDFLLNLTVEAKLQKPAGNGLLIVALSGFLVLISGGLLFYSREIPVSYGWGTLVTVCATVLVLLRRSQQIPARAWSFVVLALICLDLGGVDSLNLNFRSAEEVLGEGQQEAQWLMQHSNEPFRVYSPSYSLPQQTAAASGLQLADGIDPLQLTAYAAFMQNADGIADPNYSVTLPPYASGSPAVDNQNKTPDPVLLGQLNVKYLVSAFPVSAPGLNFEVKIGQSWIYSNSDFLPRAWIQADQNGPFNEIVPVDLVSFSPNEIELQTSQTGWLVLSEINYPGWAAYVDGIPAPLVEFKGLFRSVALSAGPHVVDFVFNPVSVNWGLGLSLLGWIIVGAGLWWGRKKGW